MNERTNKHEWTIKKKKYLKSAPLCIENELEDEQIIQLAPILEAHPTLKILSLSNNNFSEPGAKAIAGALKKNGAIQTLSIIIIF